jgi:hypothetical protein
MRSFFFHDSSMDGQSEAPAERRAGTPGKIERKNPQANQKDRDKRQFFVSTSI